MTQIATPQTVLDFWFGMQASPEHGKPRKSWFVKKAAFDQEIRDRFLPTYEAAAAGNLNLWQVQAQSCLALLIVLDQFPRNLFRRSPQAFATDAMAVETAQKAIEKGFDQQLLPVQRWFVYLPFEHSEKLEHQVQSVRLFETLRDDPDSAGTIDYAHRHYAVIQRFGRFPHRNRALERNSTPEEINFLRQPGSSFG